MMDVVSLLSLQARSRRNARRALRSIQRQRAQLAEATRVLDEAAGSPARAPSGTQDSRWSEAPRNRSMNPS